MNRHAVILAAVATLSMAGMAKAASATLTFDDVTFDNIYASPLPAAYYSGYDTGLSIGGNAVTATISETNGGTVNAFFGDGDSTTYGASPYNQDHTPTSNGAMIYGDITVTFNQAVYVSQMWVDKYFYPAHFLSPTETMNLSTPELYTHEQLVQGLANGRDVTINAYNGATLVKTINVAGAMHIEHWRLDQVAWRDVIGLSDTAITSFTITGNANLPAGTAASFLDDLTISDTAVTPLFGDFNRDGTVDVGDYTIWADKYDTWIDPAMANVKPYDVFGAITKGVDLRADANGNGWTDLGDYTIWADSYGQTNIGASAVVAVPEPASLSLLALSGLAMLRRRRA